MTAGTSDAPGSLTDVPGVGVGHATVEEGTSGCTVVLGPFRGAVDVRGMASGTRELDALDPTHVVPEVDALLLTGGSAWGLAAADGVMGWLAEQGRGFRPTSDTLVPIVPAAVIFDLDQGRSRPSAATGRRACEAAGDGPVREGRVGAGAGATVGKVAGRSMSSPGGVGSAARRLGGHRVAALAVVNALGDVRGPSGFVVAGTRDRSGAFPGSDRVILQRHEERPGEPGGTNADTTGPRTSTTLGVVATDAPLSRTDLQKLARVAATAVPRRVDPAHTPFDGDIVFALSPTAEVQPLAPGDLLALGVAGRDALEEAVVRGVGAGGSARPPHRRA